MTSSYLDGVIPIAVMPFDENDQIDLKALKSEIDFLVSIGIKWVGFGYGSEVYTLAEGELIKALTHSVEVAKAKIGIIGNVELNSTKGAIERVNNIKATGAAMAMSSVAGSAARTMSCDPIFCNDACSDCSERCSHQRLAPPGAQRPAADGCQQYTGTTGSPAAAAKATAG